MLQASELILNPDGSVYHLGLKPEHISKNIITVGDQERVELVAAHLDEIEFKTQVREFKTVTGIIENQRISIISTGIGTDNIDIVLNEIDALLNVDLESRLVKEKHTALNIIRIGTSGAIRSEIPIDSMLISNYAIGFDGLLSFYTSEDVRELDLETKIKEKIDLNNIYAVKASDNLLKHFSQIGLQGMTITAPGFYGPQSRGIRLGPKFNLPDLLSEIDYNNFNCTNLEMETAGIYGLSKMMGHNAVSLNAILANRITGEFSKNPSLTIHKLIEKALELIKIL